MNLNHISKGSYQVSYQRNHNERIIRDLSNGLGNLITNQRSRSINERESTLTERAEYLYLKPPMKP